MERKKEKAKKASKPTSPEKTIGEMASDLASKKRRTRQSDATVSLPLRMFCRGQEPCKKKVNSYFSLSYLEVVKKALEEDQIQILLDSQFGTLLEIGNKISFSVKFAHFLLCRQLVTKKTQEIWVLFGGQPIRFSIREFALATSLNCKVLTNEDDIVVSDQTKMFAKDLFGQEVPPTPKWIVEKLSGAPYKDRETRMRLALLLIVEGVLCRTSGEAKISLESIEVVRDIGRFLGYPWGRKSFDMTMASIQSSLVHKYTQSSAAIQGFTHALQMVVLACSPNVLATDVDCSFSAGSDDEETNAVKGVFTKPMNLYMPLVRRLDQDDKGRQGDVISIMPARPDQRGVEKLLQVTDVSDPSVDYLLSLIRAKHKFTHQSWKGGVRAADIVKPRKVEEGESNQIDLQKLIANVGDACYERVKTLNEEMAVKMQDMLDLAVTSIETDVLLKFSQMERMIGGIFDIIRRSGPTANDPRPLSESTTSGTIPPEDATKSGSDGVNQTMTENVESPNGVVRNVLADLNAVSDEVSGGGDEIYGEEDVDTNPIQNTKMDVEDRNVLVDLNDVGEEVSSGGNETSNEDQVSSKSSEKKKMDAGLLSEENKQRSASKAMVDEQEDNDAHDSQPQPLDCFPRGDDFLTMGIVPYQDPEDQVILLGYKNEDVVPVTDEDIRQTMDVEIGGKYDAVGETCGTVNNEGNVDQPPSFSLGLTQELQKRKMFSQFYTRKKKRTKYASSSLTDFVVDLPGQGIHCVVSDMFKPPPKDEVDMISKLMEKPSYFPTYHGHTLTEANFIELLSPTKLTSTLMMSTLVSYLHDDVLLQSKSKHPVKYDVLDHTFVHDIGLLHALIEPDKRRKKLPIEKFIVDYVKSRRNLYTQVDTLLCPFLIEGKHWVGVVVNLPEHNLVVLDCNEDVVDTPKIDAVLSPFASALPYVIRQLAYNSEMKHATLDAFQITIPTLKTHLSDPELSGIASLMLMLLHVHNKLNDNIELTRTQVVGGSNHYAVDLFHTVMKGLPH